MTAVIIIATLFILLKVGAQRNIYRRSRSLNRYAESIILPLFWEVSLMADAMSVSRNPVIRRRLTKINSYMYNYLIFVIINSSSITLVGLSSPFHGFQFEGTIIPHLFGFWWHIHLGFIEDHVYYCGNNIGFLKKILKTGIFVLIMG